MTQKQFKQSLLRGQGRCVKAVQADPEKYRNTILWACSHRVAFDPQCEGTRAWFVYQLIGCYADKKPFLDAAIAGIQKAKSNGGWVILYLAELLTHFVIDGETAAEDALWGKYEELYAALLKKKQPPKGIFPERDDFAMLCQVIGEWRGTMVKIAEDIGRLYLEKEFYNGDDFDWLFAICAKRCMGMLKKRAEKSENIAAYLKAGFETEESWKKESLKVERTRTGRSLAVWLKRQADEETERAYAKAYLEQTELDARAEALGAFALRAFPGDPTPIIEDAKSEHLKLREAAWEALGNVRHPLVRQVAIEHLREDVETVLPVLIMNYQKDDEEMLIELVKSVKVDFACTTAWHSVHGDVLNMKDYGLKAPKELLYHIFDTTYCSCCREYALLQMGKRRLLTAEILEECLFDSSYDIRAYAKRCFARRKKQTV